MTIASTGGDPPADPLLEVCSIFLTTGDARPYRCSQRRFNMQQINERPDLFLTFKKEAASSSGMELHHEQTPSWSRA